MNSPEIKKSESLFGVLVKSYLCPSPEGNKARTEHFKCLKIGFKMGS